MQLLFLLSFWLLRWTKLIFESILEYYNGICWFPSSKPISILCLRRWFDVDCKCAHHTTPPTSCHCWNDDDEHLTSMAHMHTHTFDKRFISLHLTANFNYSIRLIRCGSDGSNVNQLNETGDIFDKSDYKYQANILNSNERTNHRIIMQTILISKFFIWRVTSTPYTYGPATYELNVHDADA